MIDDILVQLEEKGKANIKKKYINYGAVEPVFGVTIKDLKPIVKQIGVNQEIANELYNSKNFDAMYLAGMVADCKNMSVSDYNDWIKKAYCYYIGDFTVAIMLTDSPHCFEIANDWIKSDDNKKISAGFYTYTWLIGNKVNTFFDKEEILKLMLHVKDNINDSEEHIKVAMNDFLHAVGISYTVLSDEAVQISQEIGEIGKIKPAYEKILSDKEKGRFDFKRKNVRC